MNITYETCAKLTGGRLVNCPEISAARITAVMTDSRESSADSVFFALRGPNFDGHDFIAAAHKQGAVLVVVEEEMEAAKKNLAGLPGIIVEDTTRALGRLARGLRWRDPLIPWVGITGSSGKTTTRMILAHLLATCGKVATSPGNFNNQIGLPLSIIRRSDSAWAGVVELGSSARGEIRQLTGILQPTIAIVTNIGAAHLAGLGDLLAVAEEKSAIFSGGQNADHHRENGNAPDLGIYPAATPQADILRAAISGRAVSFALENDTGIAADWLATEIRSTPQGTCFKVGCTEFSLPLFGRHNVENCLAALIAADTLGVSLREAAAALRTLSPVAGRLALRTIGSVQVLDDTYNANPDSLAAGLEVCTELTAPRKVAVLGDMLELGEASRRLHHAAGKKIAAAGFDLLLTVGQEAAAIAEGASALKVRHYARMEDLLADLPPLLMAGDLLYVKGSRGMKMERVLAALAPDNSQEE